MPLVLCSIRTSSVVVFSSFLLPMYSADLSLLCKMPRSFENPRPCLVYDLMNQNKFSFFRPSFTIDRKANHLGIKLGREALREEGCVERKVVPSNEKEVQWRTKCKPRGETHRFLLAPFLPPSYLASWPDDSDHGENESSEPRTCVQRRGRRPASPSPPLRSSFPHASRGRWPDSARWLPSRAVP